MTRTVDFQTFAADSGAFVATQGDYLAASYRVTGFPSGILTKQKINKVLRQTSAITTSLANAISVLQDVDMLDDGNTSALTNKFLLAFSAYLPFNSGTNYPAGTIGYALKVGAGSSVTQEAVLAVLGNALTSNQLASSLLNRINLIDAPTTGLVTKVADLQSTYGSTAAASTSAAAALASQILAATKAAEAVVSAGAALTSETNANSSKLAAASSAGTASTSAATAVSSASSATGSASTATNQATTATNAASTATGAASTATTKAAEAASSATAAGTFATNSETSKLAAQSAASTATASKDTAVAAASTATGAASTATTQAGLASTSASNAGISATAASNSASTATTQAGLAGSSASAANTSEVNASASAATATSAVAGVARANIVARDLPTGSTQPTNFAWGLSGWGFVYSSGAGGTAEGARINVSPLQPSVPYSLSFKARIVSGGNQTVSIDFFPDTLPQTTVNVTSDITEFKWQNVSSASADWATAALRWFMSPWPAGVVIEITDIKLEQNTVCTAFVSNPRDIQSAATAAATSASSAIAEADAAEQSASAAQSSATAAETASTNASTSQTQASNSATTATGAASTATTQATTATNAANSAQNFSNSALGFSNTAQTAANNASVSAGQSANSVSLASGYAASAANWYNQTVSATGDLSAAVTLQGNTLTTLDGRVGTAESNFVLKVAATRADGKKVFAGVGVAAVNNATVQQSQIVFTSDSLVFVPPNGLENNPVQFLEVGLVDGVVTLRVPAARIGELNGNKITAGTMLADRFLLTSGTVDSTQNLGVILSSQDVAGAGGGYGSMANPNSTGYTLSGVPVNGNIVSTIDCTYAGQSIHFSCTGFLDLQMASNWSGASDGHHGVDVSVQLRIVRVSSGTVLDSGFGIKSANSVTKDVTYLTTVRNRVVPFSIVRGIAAPVPGRYVAIIYASVNTFNGTSTSLLKCMQAFSTAMQYSAHAFLNAI